MVGLVFDCWCVGRTLLPPTSYFLPPTLCLGKLSENKLDSLGKASLLSSLPLSWFQKSVPRDSVFLLKDKEVWRNLQKDTPVGYIVARDAETPSYWVVPGRCKSSVCLHISVLHLPPLSLGPAQSWCSKPELFIMFTRCGSVWNSEFVYLEESNNRILYFIIKSTSLSVLRVCDLPLKPSRQNHFQSDLSVPSLCIGLITISLIQCI